MAIQLGHKVYDNFVLENQFESNLITKLDFNQFVKANNTLTSAPGMTVKINTYTAGSGAVEPLEMGSGNTLSSTVSFIQNDYTVKCYQGQFAVYDEQVMTDPTVLDVGLNGLADDFVNLVVEDVIAEMDKGTAKSVNVLDFNAVVDILADYPGEDESGLYLLVGKDQQAKLRKSLGEELKYVEDYVRSGYIGSVCGVPVYVSKAVADGTAYLGHRDAITYFGKAGVSSEVERDANTRQTNYIMRKYGITAITDATKVIKITITGGGEG